MDAFQEIEKDWYCTAKHLHSLLEDAKHERTADFGLPCCDCKYNIGGIRCNMGQAYSTCSTQCFGTLTGAI